MMKSAELAMDLPYITANISGIGGEIRAKVEDFVVEEVPLYPPGGKGGHLYVNLTKKGFTTKEIHDKLASILNLDPKKVGYAGMKDKNAVTTQTFSVDIGNADEGLVEKTIEKIRENLPVTINWTKLHNNKIKPGHLLGNKFEIKVTNLEMSTNKSFENAEDIIEAIKKKGLSNFYGPQRFGIEGKNPELGLELIKGKKKIKDRWLRKFLIDSYRSYLCNRYLSLRVESGNFEKIMKGDIAKKYDTGGLFEVEDTKKEQPRYDNHEISFTAPIYGLKMWDATGPSGKLEKKIIEMEGLDFEKFSEMKLKGTRRLGRLLVPDISVSKFKGGLLLKFYLPKGAFATTVLREIMKVKLR